MAATIPNRVAAVEGDVETIAAEVARLASKLDADPAALAVYASQADERLDGLADELAAVRTNLRRLEEAFRDLAIALEDAGALARRAAT